MSHRLFQSGVTLIEVLIAVLVSSVAVLGVAGLQMLGMQSNRAALLRTEAVHIAHDMLERMRANAVGVGAAQHYGGLALGDPPPNPPDCGAGDCTAREVADFDRALWKCRLGRFRDHPACAELIGVAGSGLVAGDLDQAPLPDGDGAIEFNRAGTVVGIHVQWREGSHVRSVSVASRL